MSSKTDYITSQRLELGPGHGRRENLSEQSFIDYSGHGPRRLVQYFTRAEYNASAERYVSMSIATLPTRLCRDRMQFSPFVEHMAYKLGPITGVFTVIPNTTIEVEMMRPVVVTRCTLGIDGQESPDTPLPYVREDGRSWGEISSFREFIQDHIDRGGNITTIDHLPPFWAPHPGPGSSSLIGVFPVLFKSGNTSHPFPTVSNMFTSEGYIEMGADSLVLETCTISPFWEPSRHEMTPDYGSEILRSSPLAESGYSKLKYRIPIAINIGSIPGFNDTNIIQLMAGEMETMLAISFATSLSEIPRPGTDDRCGRLTGRDPGGKNVTTFKYKTIQYGYGYGNPSTSVRLALVVITTYCMVTSGYMVYLLTTGLTSTAWNSPIELVVLALQSKRPDHLGHTSVGIDSMETYREEVGIRVNNQEQLELVFAHDKDAETRGLRKVIPNKSY